MRLFGRAEQQAIDRTWQQVTGLPLLLLMEAAAAAVARICAALLTSSGQAASRILVLAGSGQNGGDAYACARLLYAGGWQVACRDVLPPDRLPPEARMNRQALLALGLTLGPPQADDFFSLGAGSLIVDGIFGTGFRGDKPLPEPVVQASSQVATARARGARVVAIDIPTGVDADCGSIAPGTIAADITVTFIRPKIGICAAPGRFFAGRVETEPLGVPAAIIEQALANLAGSADRQASRPPCHLIDGPLIAALQPPRPPDSHKGLFGKLLLLGGAPGMPGAILLACEAAARSGTGLVRAAVPSSVAPLLLAARPDCLLNALPDSPDTGDLLSLVRELAAGQTAVAAGPGAGNAAWLHAALPFLIGTASQLVLDADALNHIASQRDFYLNLLRERCEKQHLPPAVLTPHPGEFRRLAPDTPLDDRQAAAAALAGRSRSVVVLKGASTAVAEPEGAVWINPTGHQGLARGGSGDVLCGLIAGFLAQGLAPLAAAQAGVYLHGLAAEAAGVKYGVRAMLPGDVIASLGEAFNRAGWENAAGPAGKGEGGLS